MILHLRSEQEEFLLKELQERIAASPQPLVTLLQVVHAVSSVLLLESVVQQTRALKAGSWGSIIQYEIVPPGGPSTATTTATKKAAARDNKLVASATPGAPTTPGPSNAAPRKPGTPAISVGGPTSAIAAGAGVTPVAGGSSTPARDPAAAGSSGEPVVGGSSPAGATESDKGGILIKFWHKCANVGLNEAPEARSGPGTGASSGTSEPAGSDATDGGVAAGVGAVPPRPPLNRASGAAGGAPLPRGATAGPGGLARAPPGLSQAAARVKKPGASSAGQGADASVVRSPPSLRLRVDVLGSLLCGFSHVLACPPGWSLPTVGMGADGSHEERGSAGCGQDGKRARLDRGASTRDETRVFGMGEQDGGKGAGMDGNVVCDSRGLNPNRHVYFCPPEFPVDVTRVDVQSLLLWAMGCHAYSMLAAIARHLRQEPDFAGPWTGAAGMGRASRHVAELQLPVVGSATVILTVNSRSGLLQVSTPAGLDCGEVRNQVERRLNSPAPSASSGASKSGNPTGAAAGLGEEDGDVAGGSVGALVSSLLALRATVMLQYFVSMAEGLGLKPVARPAAALTLPPGCPRLFVPGASSALLLYPHSLLTAAASSATTAVTGQEETLFYLAVRVRHREKMPGSGVPGGAHGSEKESGPSQGGRAGPGGNGPRAATTTKGPSGLANTAMGGAAGGSSGNARASPAANQNAAAGASAASSSRAKSAGVSSAAASVSAGGVANMASAEKAGDNSGMEEEEGGEEAASAASGVAASGTPWPEFFLLVARAGGAAPALRPRVRRWVRVPVGLLLAAASGTPGVPSSSQVRAPMEESAARPVGGRPKEGGDVAIKRERVEEPAVHGEYGQGGPGIATGRAADRKRKRGDAEDGEGNGMDVDRSEGQERSGRPAGMRRVPTHDGTSHHPSAGNVFAGEPRGHAIQAGTHRRQQQQQQQKGHQKHGRGDGLESQPERARESQVELRRQQKQWEEEAMARQLMACADRECRVLIKEASMESLLRSLGVGYVRQEEEDSTSSASSFMSSSMLFQSSSSSLATRSLISTNALPSPKFLNSHVVALARGPASSDSTWLLSAPMRPPALVRCRVAFPRKQLATMAGGPATLGLLPSYPPARPASAMLDKAGATAAFSGGIPGTLSVPATARWASAAGQPSGPTLSARPGRPALGRVPSVGTAMGSAGMLPRSPGMGVPGVGGEPSAHGSSSHLAGAGRRGSTGVAGMAVVAAAMGAVPAAGAGSTRKALTSSSELPLASSFLTAEVDWADASKPTLSVAIHLGDPGEDAWTATVAEAELWGAKGEASRRHAPALAVPVSEAARLAEESVALRRRRPSHGVLARMPGMDDSGARGRSFFPSGDRVATEADKAVASNVMEAEAEAEASSPPLWSGGGGRGGSGEGVVASRGAQGADPAARDYFAEARQYTYDTGRAHWTGLSGQGTEGVDGRGGSIAGGGNALTYHRTNGYNTIGRPAEGSGSREGRGNAARWQLAAAVEAGGRDPGGWGDDPAGDRIAAWSAPYPPPDWVDEPGIVRCRLLGVSRPIPGGRGVPGGRVSSPRGERQGWDAGRGGHPAEDGSAMDWENGGGGGVSRGNVGGGVSGGQVHEPQQQQAQGQRRDGPGLAGGRGGKDARRTAGAADRHGLRLHCPSFNSHQGVGLWHVGGGGPSGGRAGGDGGGDAHAAGSYLAVSYPCVSPRNLERMVLDLARVRAAGTFFWRLLRQVYLWNRGRDIRSEGGEGGEGEEGAWMHSRGEPSGEDQAEGAGMEIDREIRDPRDASGQGVKMTGQGTRGVRQQGGGTGDGSDKARAGVPPGAPRGCFRVLTRGPSSLTFCYEDWLMFSVTWTGPHKCQLTVSSPDVFTTTKYLESLILASAERDLLEAIHITARPSAIIVATLRPPLLASFLQRYLQEDNAVAARALASVAASTPVIRPADAVCLPRSLYRIRVVFRGVYAADLRIFAGGWVWIGEGLTSVSALSVNSTLGGGAQGAGASGANSQHSRGAAGAGAAGADAGASWFPACPAFQLFLRTHVATLGGEGEADAAMARAKRSSGTGVWVRLPHLHAALLLLYSYFSACFMFVAIPAVVRKALRGKGEGAMVSHDKDAFLCRFSARHYGYEVKLVDMRYLDMDILTARDNLGPDNWASVAVTEAPEGEALSPADISELRSYFRRRVVCPPNDLGRHTSFLDLLVLPGSLLREFVGLMRWEREGLDRLCSMPPPQTPAGQTILPANARSTNAGSQSASADAATLPTGQPMQHTAMEKPPRGATSVSAHPDNTSVNPVVRVKKEEGGAGAAVPSGATRAGGVPGGIAPDAVGTAPSSSGAAGVTAMDVDGVPNISTSDSSQGNGHASHAAPPQAVNAAAAATATAGNGLGNASMLQHAGEVAATSLDGGATVLSGASPATMNSAAVTPSKTTPAATPAGHRGPPDADASKHGISLVTHQPGLDAHASKPGIVGGLVLMTMASSLSLFGGSGHVAHTAVLHNRDASTFDFCVGYHAPRDMQGLWPGEHAAAAITSGGNAGGVSSSAFPGSASRAGGAECTNADRAGGGEPANSVISPPPMPDTHTLAHPPSLSLPWSPRTFIGKSCWTPGNAMSPRGASINTGSAGPPFMSLPGTSPFLIVGLRLSYGADQKISLRQLAAWDKRGVPLRADRLSAGTALIQKALDAHFPAPGAGSTPGAGAAALAGTVAGAAPGGAAEGVSAAADNSGVATSAWTRRGKLREVAESIQTCGVLELVFGS
eukprot:jgi/Mesvir1/25945/Mv20938-RA.2